MMMGSADLHPGLVLVIFLGATYGLANAIAVLKIGQMIFGIGYCPEEGCKDPGHPKELRRFLGRIPYAGDLFYCPPCLAFWIGMLISVLVVSPSRIVIRVPWHGTIMDGLLASGAIWLLHLIAERLSHKLKL